MGEETESRVVKLKCVKLWTLAMDQRFPYFDVMVDYGIGDLQIRMMATPTFGARSRRLAPLG